MNWRSRATRVTAAVLVCFAVGATVPASAHSPHVTDAADDAYRIPETPLGQPEPRPSMPLLSNDTADVLSASLTTARPVRRDDNGAYKISIVVAGDARAEYNYVIGARFGADCWIFHYLTPGETRRAITGCGEGDSFRVVGTVHGSAVSATGSSVSATFSFRRFALPTALRKDPTLGPFFVMTCPRRGPSNWACESEDILDWAWSDHTYEF